MKRLRPIHRNGFTLIELVLSMAVMTILMGGIASAMLLASRAMPDRQTPPGLIVNGYYAADRLASELYAAQTISVRTATAVTFTVADRNADTNPETIRYAWNGVAGQPLTRQYNNGTAEALVDDVHQFDLRYDTQTVSGQVKVTVVHITVRCGADAAARIDTSVQLLNQPL